MVILIILLCFVADGLSQNRIFRRTTRLNDNIVAFWKLEEASGNRADEVGSNTLVDNNTVTQATGIQGNAADFENTNDEFLDITDNAALSSGDVDFTLAAWCNFESLTSNKGVIGKWDGGANNREYAIFLNFENTGVGGSDDVFEFQTRNSSDVASRAKNTASGDLSAGNNYFIMGWHDASADQIWVELNVTSQNTVTSAVDPVDSTSDFELGAETNVGAGNDMDGWIDAVGMWKKTFTLGERKMIYNNGAGRQHPF